MRTPRPTAAFLVAHPAHFVALGFGAGLSRIAPGTVGTLVAVPLALVLERYASAPGYLLAIVAVTAIGIVCVRRTTRDLGVPDHGGIVIDEIAAFLLVLFFAGGDILRQCIAFLLFRFFDIVKPPPIRQVDAAMKSAAGVMLDDFLAAGYTLLVLAIGQRVVGG